MKRFVCLGLGLGMTAAAMWACGGADQSSLTGDSGNAGGDGGTQPDTTVPPDDSGPTQDVIVPDDVPIIVDVITVDVPVKPADSKIQCGNALTCDAQTQICCHHTSSTQQYQCVSSVGDCSGLGDVPIGCSSGENCASQGNPTYTCCATITNGGNCNLASDVSCQQDCTQTDQLVVGCSMQLQDCPTNQSCHLSTCTLTGYNICF